MRTAATPQVRASTSVVAFLTALAMVMALGLQPAQADDSGELDPGVGLPGGVAITAEEYETLFSDLTQSNFKRSTQVVDGVRQVTFTVPLPEANEFGDEFEFTMAAPHPARGPSGDDEFSPQGVGGGVDLTGMYVSFGPTSQGMIAAGLGASLAAAICSAPAVGWLACTIWSGIIASALVWLVANGFCPGNQHLRVYITGWNRVTCA